MWGCKISKITFTTEEDENKYFSLQTVSIMYFFLVSTARSALIDDINESLLIAHKLCNSLLVSQFLGKPAIKIRSAFTIVSLCAVCSAAQSDGTAPVSALMYFSSFSLTAVLWGKVCTHGNCRMMTAVPFFFFCLIRTHVRTAVPSLQPAGQEPRDVFIQLLNLQRCHRRCWWEDVVLERMWRAGNKQKKNVVYQQLDEKKTNTKIYIWW